MVTHSILARSNCPLQKSSLPPSVAARPRLYAESSDLSAFTSGKEEMKIKKDLPNISKYYVYIYMIYVWYIKLLVDHCLSMYLCRIIHFLTLLIALIGGVHCYDVFVYAC